MLTEFARRRGYDMKRWLPVLIGRIVKSTEASEQFLWDFRKTQADLITENHYDQLTGLLRRRGMGRYTESHESGRAFIGDGMDVKGKADIPMSAMVGTARFQLVFRNGYNQRPDQLHCPMHGCRPIALYLDFTTRIWPSPLPTTSGALI